MITGASLGISWLGQVELILLTVCCWCWLVALTGIAKRSLNFSNRLLQYATGANMPVYVLHQMVIVMIGFYVIQWSEPIWLKYPVVVAGAFAISLLGYEIIRRVNVLRFLFGLKFNRKQRRLRRAHCFVVRTDGIIKVSDNLRVIKKETPDNRRCEEANPAKIGCLFCNCRLSQSGSL